MLSSAKTCVMTVVDSVRRNAGVHMYVLDWVRFSILRKEATEDSFAK